MEAENSYDEVLIRYLLNEGTAEEEKWVLEWVSASESNRMHLKGLANTLKLVEIRKELGKLDEEKEWEFFLQRKEADVAKVIPIAQQVTGEGIFPEEGRSRKRVFRFLVATAAASVILMLSFGLGLWNNNHKTVKQVAAREDHNTPGNIDPLLVTMVHEVNTSGSVRKINLPDGSRIDLYPNSEITFREPSERNKREVLLKGKADFKVAKDRSKPFTVFSGEISTTALGTRFTVTEMHQQFQILVQLHEGKVVVRSTRPEAVHTMNNMYLVPGQELVYDVVRRTALVRTLVKEVPLGNKVTDSIRMVNDNPSVPAYGKRSWFMFNNQSLSDIFDALADMYDVKIVYPKKEISKMYFIGTFYKSDSVEYILKQIASINNLVVQKDSNTYTIKRQAEIRKK